MDVGVLGGTGALWKADVPADDAAFLLRRPRPPPCRGPDAPAALARFACSVTSSSETSM